MARQIVEQLDHQVELREPCDQAFLVGFVFLYISIQPLDSG